MKKYVLGLVIAVAVFVAANAYADVNVYTESGNYGSGATNDRYLPSGWMGDTGDIAMTDAFATNPHSGATSTQVKYGGFSYSGTNGWAGVYWQQPEGNWGANPGLNLSGATSLQFYARGQNGGEKVTIGGGGIVGSPNSDSFKVFGTYTLNSVWTGYSLSLSGKDMKSVIGGLYWSAAKNDNPNGLTFYLDDVVYKGNVVPEPSSLLLLGSGVLGMLSFGKKKKA